MLCFRCKKRIYFKEDLVEVRKPMKNPWTGEPSQRVYFYHRACAPKK